LVTKRGERMKEEPHTCDLHYHGIRENCGKVYEVYICEICGREEYREYTGTQDTIEWRV
jgi:rRNA maturation endonuclease Nob1